MSNFLFLNVITSVASGVGASTVYVFNEPESVYTSFAEQDCYKRWYKHDCLLYERSAKNTFRVNRFSYLIYNAVVTGDGMTRVKLPNCTVSENIVRAYIFDEYSAMLTGYKVNIAEDTNNNCYSLCPLELSTVTCR